MERCTGLCNVSPMAVYRLVCAFDHQGLVTVLTRCRLPLPTYFLADEKHGYCRAEEVYLPTIVSGGVETAVKWGATRRQIRNGFADVSGRIWELA